MYSTISLFLWLSLPMRTPSRIRTDTLQDLNLLSLPLDYGSLVAPSGYTGFEPV